MKGLKTVVTVLVLRR